MSRPTTHKPVEASFSTDGGPLLSQQKAILNNSALSEHGNKSAGLWLARMALASIGDAWALRERDKEWPTIDGTDLDRDDAITSSEIGKACYRGLFFDKRSDVAPSGEIREKWDGVAERGRTAEDWLADNLSAGLPDNVRMNGHGWLQRTFYTLGTGNHALSGTPDGWLEIWEKTNYDDKLVERVPLEFKSVDPRANLFGDKFPRDNHVLQLQNNAALIKAWSARVSASPQAHAHIDKVYNLHYDAPINYGLLIYVDTNDYSRMRVCLVPCDAGARSAALSLASEIARTVFAPTVTRPEQLTPNGALNGACEFCAYRHACSSAAPKKEGVSNYMQQAAAAAIPSFDQLFMQQVFSGLTHRPRPTTSIPFPPREPEPLYYIDDTMSEPPAPTGETSNHVTNGELVDLISYYYKRKQTAKEIDHDLDEVGGQIKQRLLAMGVDSVVVMRDDNSLVAEVSEIAGRKTLDVERYAAATKVDPAPYYKTGKPSLRLTVKKMGDKD